MLAPDALYLPDLWGEGALFAFSGLDGPTDVASGFVATLGSAPLDLLLHTPRRRRLRLQPEPPCALEVVTGDVIAGRSGACELVLVWTAWHTLACAGPAWLPPDLSFEDGGEVLREDGFVLAVDGPRDTVALGGRNGRFALAFGIDAAEALARVREGLQADLAAAVAARLAWVRRLPRRHDRRRDRLLRKCLSVMKVNTLAAEGANQRLWSTPDRVPHRHMWLWDSVFHSFAMNRVDPAVSWSFLAAVLERQRNDGMVPHMMPAHEPASAITQPPILAWGVWENHRHTGDRRALEWALPRLEAYLTWNLDHRDSNANELLEWHIEGDPRCRSGESGMDNSPRFDRAVRLDAVDFSTYQAQDMQCTAAIAAAVGASAAAARWQERAASMRAQVFSRLWRDGFYHDFDMGGAPVGVKAVSGFLPLLLPGIPSEHVQALVNHLCDPDTFGAPFPVPSVSLDDPAFATDMWRGATWANLNYAVILGLRRQGRTESAHRLAAQTVEHVARYYESSGVLYEFFDARDKIPPHACDRKGAYRGHHDLREKVDSIRDYHWTAAVAACLLLED